METDEQMFKHFKTEFCEAQTDKIQKRERKTPRKLAKRVPVESRTPNTQEFTDNTSEGQAVQVPVADEAVPSHMYNSNVDNKIIGGTVETVKGAIAGESLIPHFLDANNNELEIGDFVELDVDFGGDFGKMQCTAKLCGLSSDSSKPYRVEYVDDWSFCGLNNQTNVKPDQIYKIHEPPRTATSTYTNYTSNWRRRRLLERLQGAHL